MNLPNELSNDERTLEEIVESGPGGAFAVAGVATAIVLLIYLAFYVFAYLPRGVVR